jgi:hypothetical protein
MSVVLAMVAQIYNKSSANVSLAFELTLCFPHLVLDVRIALNVNASKLFNLRAADLFNSRAVRIILFHVLSVRMRVSNACQKTTVIDCCRNYNCRLTMTMSTANSTGGELRCHHGERGGAVHLSLNFRPRDCRH